jgi:hypothetical protein
LKFILRMMEKRWGEWWENDGEDESKQNKL